MAENATVVTDSGAQTEVVDQSEEKYSDKGTPFYKEPVPENQDDVVDHQEEGAKETEAAEQSKQSKEDNSAARLARLKAEREAKKRAEEESVKEMDRRIANSGAINPYTGMPFQSMKEFEEYGKKVKDADISKRAKEAGKTVEEITQEDEDKEYIRKKRQEESEAAEKQKKSESEKSFFQEDLMDFMEKHPDVDVAKLDENKRFRRFCGNRYGKEPLASLYEDYVDIVGEIEGAAKVKADSKAERSTGTGGSGRDAMTAAQRRELDMWNENHPEMQMTPSEFMER